MKNHEARTAGSAPLPEAHTIEAHDQSEIRQNNRGHENVRGCDKGKRRYNNCRSSGHNKRENNIALKVTRKMNVGHLSILSSCIEIPRKENKADASSSKVRVESHLTLKDDVQAGSSKKYNENVGANLALKDNAFDGLDGITHLEASLGIKTKIDN
ncbi:hypothetical protein EJD97_005840 [Solanum chilense]|uniref:Uncharacterized protein n=1 Tax=Solanum chilense TaxID=4083 RepID=A0A6N2BZ17_SOLCI|nr:hypothetical protein EJD97_005840 [Solanum chilense]